MTVLGVLLQVIPDGVIDVERLTVPVKPFTGVTVRVEFRTPTPTTNDEGRGLITKSCAITVNVTETVCDSPLFVPETATVYVAGSAAPHDSAAVVVNVTVLGLILHIIPGLGETDNATGPLNPLTGEMLTVEVALAPAST